MTYPSQSKAPGASTSEPAHDAAKAVQDKLEGAADEQKNAMSGLMADVAQAIEAASGELRKRNQDQAADYAGSMGSALNGFARSLTEQSPRKLVEDLSGFARENPAAFLGSGFVLGIAIARIGKASARNKHSRHQQHGSSTSFGTDSETTAKETI